ncbi:MAG: NAD-dependent DNA ligase LigA [Treponema sp.]|nr:NAD-dependent DNA ligase LigA [Treponema sp.]
MNSKKDRIVELEKLIQKYQASYYEGEAEITDSEFDLLWDELSNLSPNSAVLKKIGAGGEVSGHGVDGFPKARHLIPMGSQDKASNPDEFIVWAGRQKAKTFLAQFKMDGASLELQFEKGGLKKAVTRGDGTTGDDITANARRMKGVVQNLDIDFTGGIRGEVIMTRAVWKEKYPSKANCRNAANGIMRRKDGEGCGDLLFMAYDAAVTNDDYFFENESNKLKWLEKRGFKITPVKSFKNADDIIAYRDDIASKRNELAFDIDGLVVKDNETDMEDLRKARPEKQIAFKFELETAFSVLREIEWSESGSTYTPIGIIDPVHIAGTTVKRANLNNPDMIRALGLKIGSAVSVVKRGEIIPKIEGLSPIQDKNKKTEIIIPDTCLTCGASLNDSGTRLYCPNPQCPKRLLHRLEKWVSVLDIRELGDKLIKQLFDKNVKSIHQLYHLTKEELAMYDRMGDLSAAKVIRHIQTKRELSLSAFVAGFDLENIAETTMDSVTGAGFDTLEKLRSASAEDLAAVYRIGEITASVIYEGLKECNVEMDKVLDTGIITIKPPKSDEQLPLRGLSFCFTGELKTMKRSEAEEKIKALGARKKADIVKDLSYLVTNDPSSGSSKNKKALGLGIKIIDENEFLRLIKSAPNKKQKPKQGELF